jgi:hypothetical protein
MHCVYVSVFVSVDAHSVNWGTESLFFQWVVTTAPASRLCSYIVCMYRRDQYLWSTSECESW